MGIDGLSFIRPWWLIMIIPSLVIYFFLLKQKELSNPWRMICNHLMYKKFIQPTFEKKNNSLHYLLLAWLCSLIALSGPSFKDIKVPIYKTANSLMIVLNLSPNMLAQDIKPNRITRARYFIEDVLHKLGDGKIGLIVYSQSGHIVTPLTSDINTITHLLPVLKPGIMPDHGNNALEALTLASESLEEIPENKKQILLITNTINEKTMSKFSNIAKQNNITVSALGVGTSTGAPIYNQNQYAKNKSGHLYLSQLKEKNLLLLSENTGGFYNTLGTNSNNFINHIVDKTTKNFNKNKNSALKKREDSGYYLIILLLIVSLIIFRQASVLTLISASLLLLPNHSYSLDILYNNNTKAYQLLKKNKTNKAQQLFEDPNWKATAAYKNKDYKQALDWYKKGNTTHSYYNQANSLVKLKKYEKALTLYKKAFDLDKENTDAKHNYSVLKKFIDQKNQNRKQKDKKNQDKKNQDKKNQDKKNQDKKNQDKKNQDKKNQDKKNQDKKNQDKKNQDKKNQDKKNQDKKNQDKKNQAKENQQLKNKQNEKLNPQQKTKDKNQLKVSKQDEQWLQQIPDNPGELLKRKFFIEKQMRQQYR